MERSFFPPEVEGISDDPLVMMDPKPLSATRRFSASLTTTRGDDPLVVTIYEFEGHLKLTIALMSYRVLNIQNQMQKGVKTSTLFSLFPP